MTETTLAKLEEGFLMGFTDREACLYAGINPSSLYRYCEENKEYSERKELLKENVKMIAKKNIYTEIGVGDKDISKWYIERKAKDEGFSLRNELTGADGKDLPTPIMPLITPDVPGNNSNKENSSTEEED